MNVKTTQNNTSTLERREVALIKRLAVGNEANYNICEEFTMKYQSTLTETMDFSFST